ncbi:hypothetical protein T265_04296 [Opisthorchis viverrini]|uniref:Uncharacterized protein n=1 Tax=Opisthorchis viverrini TaxID=6198 RepID=A0A075A0B7_OPIVI|nr:hypothetical protein T265_04296 [Opisthorchis viverrini]KER29005.1 hypothetical protein T265_04296 [Opisthorchis viverrini]
MVYQKGSTRSCHNLREGGDKRRVKDVRLGLAGILTNQVDLPLSMCGHPIRRRSAWPTGCTRGFPDCRSHVNGFGCQSPERRLCTQSERPLLTEWGFPAVVMLMALVVRVLSDDCQRQPLTDKNKTDPGNLGKSLDPVYRSVNESVLSLEDVNKKYAATGTKDDKEISSVNEFLASTIPGPLAVKVIRPSDAAIKTATVTPEEKRADHCASSHPFLPIFHTDLGAAVSIQKVYPMIMLQSEDHSLKRKS